MSLVLGTFPSSRTELSPDTQSLFTSLVFLLHPQMCKLSSTFFWSTLCILEDFLRIGFVLHKCAVQIPEESKVHLPHFSLDNSLLSSSFFPTEKVSNVTINGPSESNEGSSVTLICSSKGSEVSYYWFKANQIVEAGDHVQLIDGNLTLTPVNRSDAGSYTCLGNNSVSHNTSDSFQLVVFCKCLNRSSLPGLVCLPEPVLLVKHIPFWMRSAVSFWAGSLV